MEQYFSDPFCHCSVLLSVIDRSKGFCVMMLMMGEGGIKSPGENGPSPHTFKQL
uniref:Uncharacterized protein n=1 Tax=Anguilla anguilla TaxID=7936 RepID=A0A0E9WCR3_ANGAN